MKKKRIGAKQRRNKQNQKIKKTFVAVFAKYEFRQYLRKYSRKTKRNPCKTARNIQNLN